MWQYASVIVCLLCVVAGADVLSSQEKLARPALKRLVSLANMLVVARSKQKAPVQAAGKTLSATAPTVHTVAAPTVPRAAAPTVPKAAAPVVPSADAPAVPSADAPNISAAANMVAPSGLTSLAPSKNAAANKKIKG